MTGTGAAPTAIGAMLIPTIGMAIGCVSCGTNRALAPCSKDPRIFACPAVSTKLLFTITNPGMDSWNAKPPLPIAATETISCIPPAYMVAVPVTEKLMG